MQAQNDHLHIDLHSFWSVYMSWIMNNCRPSCRTVANTSMMQTHTKEKPPDALLAVATSLLLCLHMTSVWLDRNVRRSTFSFFFSLPVSFQHNLQSSRWLSVSLSVCFNSVWPDLPSKHLQSEPWIINVWINGFNKQITQQHRGWCQFIISAVSDRVN